MSYNLSDVEMPVGWAMPQLGELVEISSAQLDPSVTPKASFNYVAMENVEKGTGKLINFSPTLGEKIGSSKNAFKTGDVLYGKLRPYLRKAIVAPFNGVSVTDLVALRPHAGVIPEFIKYFLLSPYHMEHIELLMAGIRMPRIRTEDLLKIQIPTPPSVEQRRIVDKLEELFTRVDASLERLNQIPRLLKQFRQSILAAAYTGRLTAEFRKTSETTPVSESLEKIEVPPRPNRFSSRTKTVIDGDYALAVNKPSRGIPEGWEWTLLVDVARMESGHTPSRSHPEYWGGDIPWIGIADARDGHGKTILTTYQHTNQDGLDNSAARLLPAGTVCLSRTASVGYVVRMGVPMATSQDFANWTCTPAIDPDWLKYLLVAETNAIYRFGEGSTHTTVYFPELLAFHVALPPIEEQQEIVRRIEGLLKIADVVEENYSKARQQLDRLPQSILAKAFRGELVPQDPDDEPASELLERIRRERAQQQDQPKRKAARPRKPKGDGATKEMFAAQ